MRGVTPFPPEFAARYRAKGYWRDQPLRDVFRGWCEAFPDRIAVMNPERALTFRELDTASTNLALNLLELGLRPRDRVVLQMPNVIEFAILHFALQKIGVMPKPAAK